MCDLPSTIKYPSSSSNLFPSEPKIQGYLELMLRCNRELPEALMMMIPEAYKDSTRSLAAGDHHTPPMLLTTDRELRCASDFRAPWVQDNDSGDVKDFYECRGGQGLRLALC